MKKRLTNPSLYWINAHTHPPTNGSKVRVLNRDGVDSGATTWTDESIKYFDGWMEFAKIPPDIRAIQVSRYPFK